MKRSKYQIAGFCFTVIIGTLLRFTYAWSGNNLIAAFFSAANTSLWEQMKLIAVPMLLFSLIEYDMYGKDLSNFVAVRFLSILLGMAVIISGYYTYSGILGHSYRPINYLVFLCGVFCAYRFSYRKFITRQYSGAFMEKIGKIGIFFLIVCLILFTFAAPPLALFRAA